MPIQSQDIKVFESDTMNDADEGGGAITGNVIIDGLSNNIFEDVSTLDRVYGAVHMRKVFPAVSIQTQDKYFGAHVIISKLPGDQKIGVNLFNTENWFDRRPAAQSRVENYRAKGANYTGFLWATQYKDSKVVTIFQSETAPIPGIGEVLYLTQNSETEIQFIKIVSMEDRVQEFTDQTGTFRRRILEIEISQPLNYDFEGAQISRYDTLSPPTTIKQTVVANAAKYYSARPLEVAGAPEDAVIEVDTVYSQVIPSSLQELSITDANIGGNTIPVLDAAQGLVTVSISNQFAPGLSFYLGSPVLPGTFTFTSGGSTIVDEGGTLKAGALAVGSIDYVQGTFTFLATSPTYNGTKNVQFRPAVAPQILSDTGTEVIEDANRGYIYNFTMAPLASPGSVKVSYRSLGEWYDLFDDGSGKLEGLEDGIGTGTINYQTGTLAVTLAALPDEGSQIIYSWAQPFQYLNRSNFPVSPLEFKIQLPETGIAPGTVSVTWTGADAQAKTATADVFGVFSGDATGTIEHYTGLITLKPNSLPLGSTQFTINYDYGSPLTANFPGASKTGSVINVDLGYTNIVANTVEIRWNTEYDGADYPGSPTGDIRKLLIEPIAAEQIATDDGVGNMRLASGAIVGTINYSTGIVSFDPDVTGTAYRHNFHRVRAGTRNETVGTSLRIRQVYDYKPTGSLTEINVALRYPTGGSGYVNTKFRASDSPTATSDVVTLTQLQLDLTQGFDETIIPGSIRFTLSGKTYVDLNKNGQLYYDVSPTTGVGIFGGTVDYSTGVVNLAAWNDGANTMSLKSLATQRGKIPAYQVTFRIPNAPIRPSSVQIRATMLDGTLITATSDAQGDITAPNVVGFVEYETGVVSLEFGNLVLAAGNEGEDWYDANAVDIDGYIVEPRLVFADTMLYNAVSQTFLPLDSDILGLDPVRLPQDGRIPVYAEGDVVVILHDQETVGTYTNGTQLDLGRGRIAKLSIKDAGGNEILASTYSADLDNGLIDWIDLSGVSQPLTITDRIEDMALLTDVQITGKLTLSQPLTHNFPADETLVSNAVIYGDLFARTSIPFDQQTWTNVWSNILIGNSVAAQFNNSQYPIVVDNASCIEERWALIFTSSTTVNVIGENVGQILTGVNISTEIAPINPNTAQPFFTIPAAGWGSGWSTGNVLRFNTYAANAPLWIIQSIGQGEATDTDFTFCLEVRGDIDTP